MKKLYYLIILTVILGLVLSGCSLLSNVGQVPSTGQSGIASLTKNGIDPDPGLVGLWHFDEGEGAIIANDSSVYGNDGNIYGATIVDGKFGNALSFNGKSDYVEIDNAISLNITQGTWEAWIKFDTLPSDAGHPMNPLAKANQHWIHGSRNDPDSGTTDAIVVKIRVSGTRYCAKTTSDFITVDEWYHVAGTYDGEILKLYVNGTLVDSNTAPSGDIDTGTQIMAVGTWSTLIDYFQGTIDEVRIYDYALSLETIKGHAAGIYGFKGLLPPYAPPEEKVFKLGRTIPLKWRYTDPTGKEVDSDGANPKVEWTYMGVGDGTGTLYEEVDTPGASGLQYDALTMTWQFNWQTKGREVGTYEITITSDQAESSPIFEIELRK